MISGDETGRDPGFTGEVVVRDVHERDTIQSYFDRARIDLLLGAEFEILSCALHQIRDIDQNRHRGRWHIVSRRR